MSAASGGAVDRRSVVAEALRKIDDLTARLAVAEAGDTEPIAVVGMGCRLPGGVHDPAGLWQLLRDGGSGGGSSDGGGGGSSAGAACFGTSGPVSPPARRYRKRSRCRWYSLHCQPSPVIRRRSPSM